MAVAAPIYLDCVSVPLPLQPPPQDRLVRGPKRNAKTQKTRKTVPADSQSVARCRRVARKSARDALSTSRNTPSEMQLLTRLWRILLSERASERTSRRASPTLAEVACAAWRTTHTEPTIDDDDNSGACRKRYDWRQLAAAANHLTSHVYAQANAHFLACRPLMVVLYLCLLVANFGARQRRLWRQRSRSDQIYSNDTREALARQATGPTKPVPEG